jgi:pyrroline-5-carboxylate reductase
MGSALVRGMVHSRLTPPSRITVYDPDIGRSKRLVRDLKVKLAYSSRQAAGCSIVLLAVKPQQMESVLMSIWPYLGNDPQFLISIAAGIRTSWIEQIVNSGVPGKGIPVVRVMPNTPALARKGFSAIAGGKAASSKHVAVAATIFESVGEVAFVKEKWMDAVTAISGSGPAYFFYLIEQMVKVGISLKLPSDVAQRLAVATAQGAAELAVQSGEAPKALRAKVTSQGGTTEAAFKVFERKGLGKILREGIRAAARRAKELSR